MITKEQIEAAALNYTAHKTVSKWEYDAYIAGFNAGMDEMRAETINKDQHEADIGVQRAMIGDLLNENERLRAGADNWAMVASLAHKSETALSAENERLRNEIQAAIADMENGAKTAAISRLKIALER